MNDIINHIESDILIFADDTCLYATGSDPAETAEILSRDLERKKSAWATKWKVTFNASKSKDMIFPPINRPQTIYMAFRAFKFGQNHPKYYLGVPSDPLGPSHKVQLFLYFINL